MLDSFRKGQRWLTLIFVTLIGGVFVFFMGVGDGLSRGGRPTGNSVIELGDIRLQISDFQRLRAQQEQSLRERMGDSYNDKLAGAFLDSQTLRTMEDGAILADGAKQLGLIVSKEEVKRVIQASPGFRDETGRFNREAFEGFANYEYGSQRNFLEVMRQDLLRQKMTRILFDEVSVSDAEARLAALYQLQQVRLAYATLDTESLPADAEPDEAAVEAYAAAHEDELQQVYDERAELYARPEQIHARHLLITLAADADETATEEARGRALAARARIIEGAEFAEVAREVSEDEGTRENGGDLGFFSQGDNLGPFDEAAFALQAGDLSDPIRSDSGFHLILVEERREAGATPLADVRVELARELAIRSIAGERAQKISSSIAESIRGGESLEDAARAQMLTLERTGSLTRRPDGFVPGLGPAPELLSAAFALRLDAPSSPRVFVVGSQLVLIQLIERVEPDGAAVEDGMLALEQNLLDSKRNRVIQDWLNARRESLRESGRLLVNSELVLANNS